MDKLFMQIGEELHGSWKFNPTFSWKLWR
jgi:hypothetical protein